jgi:type II secretion system protein H
MTRRGFSLIEVMIVVAILGIIAALGVPGLLTMMRKNRLSAQAETTASFLDATRRRALGEGRCVRVITTAKVLTMQPRTVADCVKLDDAKWKDAATLRPDGAGISFATTSLTTASVPAARFDIVFRPNGRLVGNGDLDTTDDGARVTLSDPDLPLETRIILVTANGRICQQVSTNPPPALAAPVLCP